MPCSFSAYELFRGEMDVERCKYLYLNQKIAISHTGYFFYGASQGNILKRQICGMHDGSATWH